MLDHPLVPGPTSAIEEGPWHYGADYIAVYFRGEKSALADLIPKPFGVTDGLCVGYVSEIISVAESGLEIAADRPDRTVYQEAAVGVKCEYMGRTGLYFPVMWVTTEWSLLRGLLNGYQKRLADRISMTKLHPLNPGMKPVSAGCTFGGFCVKGPERTMSLRVVVERQGAPDDLPPFGPVFGMRVFPKTDGSQGSVSEPVEVAKANSRVADVWLGTGSLATTLDVGRVEPISGAVYRSGFTILGSKALK
ncbi:MAG: acetoacetate decarboxylase family protein [Nitrososphaerota archaeon]|nr:acetoacetate decarboxylase family protein [Nitrososphaerota archaeon]MDG6941769.1 acetoacetate decarboxylase family protein [Nitrososphaerota archaeon]MDG6947058.1 acetoacetate decarboxylase family protein [Nitrososphaerota archaeon]MDG6950530.1 acetoacetate decarboxylase family protein [Nitrososphaerota archaeon]